MENHDKFVNKEKNNLKAKVDKYQSLAEIKEVRKYAAGEQVLVMLYNVLVSFFPSFFSIFLSSIFIMSISISSSHKIHNKKKKQEKNDTPASAFRTSKKKSYRIGRKEEKKKKKKEKKCQLGAINIMFYKQPLYLHLYVSAFYILYRRRFFMFM